jgi:uncharacterized RDD family membrane protein YckC
MKASLRLLRLTAFVLIVPVLAIVMVFIFIIPQGLHMCFSSKRRKEAVDVWVKLWNWAQGQSDAAQAQ